MIGGVALLHLILYMHLADKSSSFQILMLLPFILSVITLVFRPAVAQPVATHFKCTVYLKIHQRKSNNKKFVRNTKHTKALSQQISKALGHSSPYWWLNKAKVILHYLLYLPTKTCYSIHLQTINMGFALAVLMINDNGWWWLYRTTMSTLC